MKYRSIAIDGPAGAGKSTVAKELAKKLNYVYIDTGAMYRATTYKAISLGIDLTNPYSYGFLENTNFVFRSGELHMDGVNMTVLNRLKEVADNVSLVSSHVPVRNKLVQLQQKIAKKNNVVMDGRDIGTVVLKDADLKIFMIASVHVRAKRRYEELQSLGSKQTLEELEEDIQRRDAYDSSREYNPLKQASDAIPIDTSDISIEEVTDLLYDKFMRKIKGE
ncbi:MAG: (d)CMP kinase [Bacilli bacterium]|nr:(d)CMP kinase [Bacilli bacterium]MBN2877411.1 (d)CMP kinase [Bacilli bacterium]